MQHCWITGSWAACYPSVISQAWFSPIPGPLPYSFSLPVQPQLLPLMLISFLQTLLLDLISLGIFPSFKNPVAASGSVPTHSPSLPAFPASFLPVLPRHSVSVPIPVHSGFWIYPLTFQVIAQMPGKSELSKDFFFRGISTGFFTYISQNHLKLFWCGFHYRWFSQKNPVGWSPWSRKYQPNPS